MFVGALCLIGLLVLLVGRGAQALGGVDVLLVAALVGAVVGAVVRVVDLP